MRIQMTHKISGTRNGEHWPAPGEAIDVPDDEAVALLRTGMAAHIETPAVPESATARKKPATRRKTA